MIVIRDILNRETLHVSEVASDSPAMATGEVTVELLSACCRLMDLLKTPENPVSERSNQREISTGSYAGELPHACGAIATAEIRASGPPRRLRA